LQCEYCNSRYNDLKKDRCDNCGATLTRKRELISDNKTSASASASKSSGKRAGIIIAVAAVMVVVFIVVLALAQGSSTNFSVYNTNTILPISTYTSGDIGDYMYAEYITYKVNSASIVNDLSQFGYEQEGIFCIVNISITTREEIGIYWAEFSLEIDGINYLPAQTDSDDTFNFNQWGEDGYFTVDGNKTAYLVFPLDSNYSLNDITLEYRELINYQINVAHRIPLAN